MIPVAPLDHLPVDEARVDVVEGVLAVVLLGDGRTRGWATRVVQALDRYDADRHIHDGRGNMDWND